MHVLYNQFYYVNLQKQNVSILYAPPLTYNPTSFLLNRFGVINGSWYPYTTRGPSPLGPLFAAVSPAFSRAATTRAFSRATRRSLGGGPANLRAARRCDGSWRTETELLSGRGALAFEYLDGRTNEILRGERFSPPTLRTGAVMLILTAVALEKKSENND